MALTKPTQSILSIPPALNSVMWTGGNTINYSGTTVYFGGRTGDNDEANTHFPAPVNGTIRNLHAAVTTGPGGSETGTFTVRINGADTAVTCVLTGSETLSSNTADTVAVSAGDKITVSVTGSASAAHPGTVGMSFIIDVA